MTRSGSGCFFRLGDQDPNDPDSPDFSKSMLFGFGTANSSPNAGVCIVDREALVDNFIVEVR